MVIGPFERKTKIRFKIMDACASFINAKEIDNDGTDITFTGYVYILKTPQISK